MMASDQPEQPSPNAGQFARNLTLACLAFLASLVVNYLAGTNVALRGRDQPSLTADLFLNWLPQYNVQWLFVWGFAFFVTVAFVGCLLEWKRAPYVIWMYALLITLRSLFIILTPMGPPPGASMPGEEVLFDFFGRWLTFGYDLFFSSHTSMPFLGFLIFRRWPTRVIMLVLSVVLASCTLIGRYHYSIDVFAAPFIAYALVQAHQWLERRIASAARKSAGP